MLITKSPLCNNTATRTQQPPPSTALSLFIHVSLAEHWASGRRSHLLLLYFFPRRKRMNLLRSREGRGKEDLGLFLLLLFWRLGETIVQKRRAANYVTGGKEGIFTALWRPAQDGGRRDDGCLFFFSSSTAASRHFQWRLTQRCVTFIISEVFPSIPLPGRKRRGKKPTEKKSFLIAKPASIVQREGPFSTVMKIDKKGTGPLYSNSIQACSSPLIA